MKIWLKIEEGKKALEKEWSKLEKIKAWDLSSVQPKEKVRQRAIKEGKTVHFGSLMELCHVKHSELDRKYWIYKGRLVFRGDCVTDETGFYAAFSEQGTSASHRCAAKYLDAIARMLGNALWIALKIFFKMNQCVMKDIWPGSCF